MQTAWIISSGSELTLGQSIDTNSAWLSRELAGRGIRPARHITVGDAAADLRDALESAARRADVILLTGGLGPTEDDLTRFVLADIAGAPLELHAASLAQLEAFFAARKRPMPERNRIQAMIPGGARPLPNSCGTAPGIFIELRGTPCFALPGVPFEMRVMFRDQVAAHLDGSRGVILSRRLSTYGRGESEIGDAIRDLMARGRNPEVGTTAQLGEIGIRINAAADAVQAALRLLDADEAEVRRRLGELVFGRDEETLAGAVGDLLQKRHATLATAESCTGGMIGQMLTATPGSSAYYLGGVVAYSNEAKERLLDVPRDVLDAHGAVSRPAAEAMAEGARRRFSADFAVSVTGIAGPSGGRPDKPVGLVYLGIAAAEGVAVEEYRFGEDAPRDVIRERAARTALNRLRLALLRRA
ncbi:Nicotinamide-nucleotide amidohydrolase PncC [Phycisphaerae bacterium RAS1]|nr:Nicotinamide-nucleotide amidohydrolase PncC [Phycisphaerae bacterium RAS1]